MSHKLRKVMVYKYQKNPKTNIFEKVESGIGRFHQFGMGIEEDERGFSNYSIAIIEMPDGTVITPRADMIKFINEKMEDANGISQ